MTKISEMIATITTFGELRKMIKENGFSVDGQLDYKSKVKGIIINGEVTVFTPKKNLDRVSPDDFKTEAYKAQLDRCIIKASEEPNQYWLEAPTQIEL